MLSDQEVKNVMFDLEKSEEIFRFRVDGISIFYLLRFSIESELRIERNGGNRISRKSFFNRVFNRIMREFQKRKKQKKINTILEQFDQPDLILESPLLFVSPSNYANPDGVGPHLLDLIGHYHREGYTINFVQRKDFSSSVFPNRSPLYNRFLPLNFDRFNELPDKVLWDLTEFLELISAKTKLNFVSKLDEYYYALKRIINESNQIAGYIMTSKAMYIFTYSVYTEPGIILACKKTQTKLIEVQHGVVLANSIYYQSALDRKALDNGYLLMPDYILTLGSEWKNILIRQKSYFDENNTFVVGTTGFDKWRNISKLKEEKDSSIRVVFFSQGRGYNNILIAHDFIEDFLVMYGSRIRELNLQIAVRPHPNDNEEFDLLAHKYEGLVAIEDPSEISSLESIASADFVFSATSMCLYEAISLGKNAISLEKFSGVIDSKYIRLVNTVEELFNFIIQSSNRQNSYEEIPYLESFDSGVLKKLVEPLELKKHPINKALNSRLS